MDLGVMFSTGALVTSLAAVTTSTLLATHHLRTAQATNSTLVIMELLTRERRSNEFIESEDYVLNRLRVEHRPDGGIFGLPAEARTHAQRIGRYYASLGVLSTFRGTHTTVLLGAVSWDVRVSWSVLEPYILAERQLRSKLYLSYFEHLVCLASAINMRTVLRQQRLRRLAHLAAPEAAVPHPIGTEAASPRFSLAMRRGLNQATDSAARSQAKPATLLGLISGALASSLPQWRHSRGPKPGAAPPATIPPPNGSETFGPGPLEARLASEVGEARDSATRADTKAATLLGVVGVASIIIATVLAAAGRGDTAGWTMAALVSGWIGAATLTAAALLLVLVVRPYLRILRPAGGPVSWMRFIGMDSPDQVISAVRAETAGPQPRETLLAGRLLPLVELAHRKHRLIRAATDLVFVATAFVAAAAVLYALAV